MRPPNWTGLNQHDPGITLVALAAWLAIGLLLARRLFSDLRSERPRRRDD